MPRRNTRIQAGTSSDNLPARKKRKKKKGGKNVPLLAFNSCIRPSVYRRLCLEEAPPPDVTRCQSHPAVGVALFEP